MEVSMTEARKAQAEAAKKDAHERERDAIVAEKIRHKQELKVRTAHLNRNDPYFIKSLDELMPIPPPAPRPPRAQDES